MGVGKPPAPEPDTHGDDGVETEYCDDCGEEIDDCTCEDEDEAPKAKAKATPAPAPKAPKAKAEPKPKATVVRTPNPELDGKDEIALMECDLDTLRKYAANDLLIVGASKIPGGKRALVQRIIEVRR